MNHTPSLRSANWLYLISIVLILTVGTLLQGLSFGWGLLGTEILLILLPVILFVKGKKLPFRSTLRLEWPGWKLVMLGLLAGIGLWLVDSTLDGFTTLLFGYSPPATPDMYPTTLSQAVLIFVSLALAPPICEEILFRGYIQRAYEGVGRRLSIVIPALLFALYHFRLQGLIALLPIAVALGYLRLRSGSLWPGIAAHFANNMLAAILLITAGLRPDLLPKLWVGTFPAFLIGLGLTLVSLMGIARRTKSQEPLPSLTTASIPGIRRFSASALLPLIFAGFLYLTIASLEIVSGWMPETMATGELTLGESPWTHRTQWRYEIRNVLDEPVGQATCEVVPMENYVLNCQTEVRAFKVELPGSFYQSGNYQVDLSLTWAGDDLSLLRGETFAVYDDSFQETTLTTSEGVAQLEVKDSEGIQHITLTDGALMPDEWAWRLMALPFSVGLNQTAIYTYPSFWDPVTEKNHPATKEMSVIVSGAEPLALPAGNFIAWRVQVGDWTVWYDINAPHTLLKYDARFATYFLVEVIEESD